MTRLVFVLFSAFTVTLLAAPLAAAASDSAGAAAVAAQPEGGVEGGGKVTVPEVDVDVGGDGGAWFLSPTWIVIGLLAVGVVIAIIVAASRGGGGGTTVIRD